MAECLVSETVRVRDGAAADLSGAKVFRAHRSPQVWHRTLDRHLLPRRPRRKFLRSLTRAGSGAIRRICFRNHVYVIDDRFARREQARSATGRGRRMERRDRFGPKPKQTGAQSGGAAGKRPARETGKPDTQVPRRGEAEWPNARSATGRYPHRDTRSRREEAERLRNRHMETTKGPPEGDPLLFILLLSSSPDRRPASPSGLSPRPSVRD